MTGWALALGAATALATGVSAVLVQIIQAVRRRGQDRVAEDATFVGTARQLVDMLRRELHEQEQRHQVEIAELREKLTLAQEEIAQLKRDLAAAGGAGAA